MKILATGDWHLDHVTRGVSRFAELERAVNETVVAAWEQKVDVYCFIGDLMDPDVGAVNYRALDVALGAMCELNRARIPSIWVAGNHDVVETAELTTTLTPLRKVAEHLTNVFVAELPAIIEMQMVNFTILPFTPSTYAYVPEEFVRAKMPEGSIVLSHLNVPGVIPGEETTEMPRGREVVYPMDAVLARKPRSMIQGHFHRRQVTKEGMQIPGSLGVLSFGEEGNTPGFLILDV